MMRLFRLGLFVVALCLGLIGMTWTAPKLAEKCGFDVWNYSKLDQECQELCQYSSQLSTSYEETRVRLEYREGLVDDLIEQRSTLAATVRQFEELNRSIPGIETSLRQGLHVENERAAACYQLIRYIESRLEPAHSTKLRAEITSWMVTEFLQ